VTTLTPPKFITAAEVAHHLSISERTVRRAIAEGRVPVVRIGRAVRIRLDDLDKLITRPR
jgi:excisionase family DNA binding protein